MRSCPTPEWTAAFSRSSRSSSGRTRRLRSSAGLSAVRGRLTLGIRGVAATGLVFGFVCFGLAVLRVFVRGFAALALGFGVLRGGFLPDFLGFIVRRRDVALLPAAFAFPRLFVAAFAFTGRAFRCRGLDRLFFPDFLAMLPPVRSD